jgi:hypothetical protein
MHHPLYSITQGDKTYLSFLTQAIGLMADLDLGTEHLRWMSDARFVYGYLRGGWSTTIPDSSTIHLVYQRSRLQESLSGGD